MVAKSGDRLMPDDAVDYFRSRMLPLADLITPNLPEAEVLLGRSIGSVEAMPGSLPGKIPRRSRPPAGRGTGP